MKRCTGALLLTALVGGVNPAPAVAQALTPLAVGTPAPDFTLVASTRGGVGEPVKLSDFKGQTVVIAFFYRVRTKG